MASPTVVEYRMATARVPRTPMSWRWAKAQPEVGTAQVGGGALQQVNEAGRVAAQVGDQFPVAAQGLGLDHCGQSGTSALVAPTKWDLSQDSTPTTLNRSATPLGQDAPVAWLDRR
jgi:hypothetical protein